MKDSLKGMPGFRIHVEFRLFSFMTGVPEKNMDWYQNLYVGETIEEKKETIIDQVEQDKTVTGLYLILLRTEEEKNQLEILSQRELKRLTPWLGPFLVIGIARFKRGAMELLTQILDQVYHESGTANMREYFLSKTGQKGEDE